jgi:hypothetical protein
MCPKPVEGQLLGFDKLSPHMLRGASTSSAVYMCPEPVEGLSPQYVP